MVASVASFGSLSLISGVTTRAGAPAAAAPIPEGGLKPPVQHAVSAVAFAPAALSALIEAQEHMADSAPSPVRQYTVAKIDRLISCLDDAPTPASNPAEAPFTVRRLLAAREALSESLAVHPA